MTQHLHWRDPYLFKDPQDGRYYIGPYRPRFDDESFTKCGLCPIVPGSDRIGMYGMNFLPVDDRLDEFIVYGWYHRLHTLGVSPALRTSWNPDEFRLYSLESQQSFGS